MSIRERLKFLYYKIKYPNELKMIGFTKYDPTASFAISDGKSEQKKIEKAKKINENDDVIKHFNSVMENAGFYVDEFGFCDKPNNIFKKIHNHFFDLKEDNYIENKSWAMKYDGDCSVTLYRCKIQEKAEKVFDIKKDKIAENIKYYYEHCNAESEEDKFVVRCDDEGNESTEIILLRDKVVLECSLCSDNDGKYEKEFMELLKEMGYESSFISD